MDNKMYCAILGVLCLSQHLFGNVFCLKTPIDLANQHGYPSETHKIQTEDGYILTTYRIPSGRNSINTKYSTNKTPILLVHGLGVSGINFLDSGPEKAFGFILADSGFDVWLANARGNSYSQEHVSMDPNTNQAAFFNFSIHEIGYYDLPANIDYILNVTGQSKMQYCGHSQGGTTFFIMASTRPEYNDKISLASLMAAAAFNVDTPNVVLQLLSSQIYFLENMAKTFHWYHLSKVLLEVVRDLGEYYCSRPQFSPLCATVVYSFAGYSDDAQLNTTFIPTIFQTVPSDISLRQLFHYGQNIKSGKFRQYDWGLAGNRLQYGTDSPPDYNLSYVTTPLALYYSQNDMFASVKDMKKAQLFLNSVILDYKIPYKKFNHVDFLYGIDVVNMLYADVLNQMLQYPGN